MDKYKTTLPEAEFAFHVKKHICFKLPHLRQGIGGYFFAW
jgi:hypothetical protein